MKKNHEFRRLYSKGKSFAAQTLVLYARPVRREYNQLGITVSTKVGKAVIRTKIRRRLQEISRTNAERFRPGFDIVAVARGRSRYVSYAQLERDFVQAAGKLGIMK
jgi:ribonuclease P protein component